MEINGNKKHTEKRQRQMNRRRRDARMLFKTNEQKNRKITQAERMTEQEETNGNMEGKRRIDKWKRAKQ